MSVARTSLLLALALAALCAPRAPAAGEDWEREEAVAALTRLGAPVAPGALQQALHDRAFRVRWAARTALRALQPQH